MFVIERSGELDTVLDEGITRWLALQSAMTTLLPQAINGQFGLLTFPMLDGSVETNNCSVSSSPDVDVGPSTELAILDRMVAADPRSGTSPTASALQSAAAYLGSTSSPRDRFVVLVAASLPDPICGDTVSAAVAAVATLRNTQGVETFVVWILGPDHTGMVRVR